MTSPADKPWPTSGMSFGGDYNPEQWSRETWDEDLRPMTEAGVNIVTLGVFSWGTVEQEEGRFDWAATDEIANRYARHPAVALWHVSNELGGGNGRCYCEVSAEAFRGWLEGKYRTIDGLNRAWGTEFWGHRYATFDQVQPPRGQEAQNPAAMLDILRRLEKIAGSWVEAARVAILFDEEAGWALHRGLKPRHNLNYGAEARKWHRALWEKNIPVDVVGPWADLHQYDLVIVATLLLVSDKSARNIASVTERGATVIVTYLSGVVDEDNRIRTEGFPGAFRDLLGTSAEEHFPLLDDERVQLDIGAAITRSKVGAGPAWYVSAKLEYEGVRSMVDEIAAKLQIVGANAPEGIEAVRRRHPDLSFLFLTNHSTEPLTVEVNGVELITETDVRGSVEVPAGEVRIVQEAR